MFLALGEVVRDQTLATMVDVVPFSGLSTSSSAKNLQSRSHMIAKQPQQENNTVLSSA
jgi:hypothetical protein